MAFQVSPGVNVSEIDASTSVPAVITNVGAVVGRFAKGPVGEIIEISSEEQLLNTFGSPNDTNYKSWFTASNFLAYSNSLKVVRVVDDSSDTVTNRARNALSGKVTAAAAQSGAVQNYVGQAQSITTLYGSSAQEFHVNTDENASSGIGTSVNLHTGWESTFADASTKQYLYPRSSTDPATSVTLVADNSGSSSDFAMRTLSASDISVFIRNAGESTGGLLPSNRYSVSSQSIEFSSNHGNKVSSGPYYVYHHGSTGQRLTTAGSAPTAMSAGFTYPLYTRQSVANLADSGIYGGDGASHVHYFTSYGGTITQEAISANTLNLGPNHGLIEGDPVVYTNDGTALTGLTANTVYYVASVSTNAITLSASYDYASSTAGTVITITGTLVDLAYLHKAFYMPSSMTAMNHSKSTAPVEQSIRPYAGLADRVTIKVAQQSVFELDKAPGSYAVANNSVTSDQAAASGDSTIGMHSSSDFTVTGGSKVITYTVNLPTTGQIETVTVPARKAFKLSTPVDLNNSETIVVKVDGVVASVGTATGQYVLSASGDMITFGGALDGTFVPADGIAVEVTISSKMTNSFVYDSALVLSKNKDQFESTALFGSNTSSMNLTGHEFIARSPGNWGNNLHVYLVDESSYDEFLQEEPAIGSSLSGVPRANDGTIDNLAPVIANSEPVSQGLSLVVTMTNDDGVVSVVEVLENLSKAGNGKTADGKNIYYVDMINEFSNYVFCVNHPQTTGMDWGTNISSTTGSVKRDFAKLNQAASTVDGSEVYISRPFGNGYDGLAPLQGHFEMGFDLYADTETVDVSFLMQGESADLSTSPEGMIGHIIGIAESRKDCVACISPTEGVVALDKSSGGSSNTTDFYAGVRKSNYAFADSNYKYMSDKYNNKFRFVPFNGDTAGLMVRSEVERDAWFSPAGFNRGVYKGVVKTMVEQTKSSRDALYKEAINPVVNFAGQGTVLFGDKTFTMRPSAFDRINVRRLFIVLEKSIATAAKFTLFEFNDEFTRAQFTSLIEPFLRDIKGRRGIYDFKVVCDSTNNTDNVIDSNQFVGDIFIQPARSINFIQLNFVAVRTGVSFDEIVGVV
jgi:hypothetical protein